MKHILRLLKWVLKAAIFFTLFAFALNNQQDITVHFFFGNQWHAPQVLVVLAAFSVGVAVGVMGMVPRWWQQRRKARGSEQPPLSVHAEKALVPAAATTSMAPAYADGI